MVFDREGRENVKVLGNVLDPFVLAEHYGVDAVRYFFLREVPFGRDGSFSDTAIVNRVNADLANDLGNLAQRSLSMIAKNCDGEIPTPVNLTTKTANFWIWPTRWCGNASGDGKI